jgi:lipid-binding SYLF domain-containing protein
MKISPYVLAPMAAALIMATSSVGIAGDKAIERLQASTRAFESIGLTIDKQISPAALQKSQGIVIIPNMIQAGLIWAGKRGSGVALIKDKNGRWSNPAFITLTGGSWGLQIGGATSKVVLLFMDKAKLLDYLSDDVSFKGGNVKGEAGPLGNAPLPADSVGKVYTYARRDGLFAGISIEGAKLGFDDNLSAKFYKDPYIKLQAIFDNKVSPSSSAEVGILKQSIEQATSSSKN